MYNLDGSLRSETQKLGALVGNTNPNAPGARAYTFEYWYDRDSRVRQLTYPANLPGMPEAPGWRGMLNYAYGTPSTPDARGLLGSVVDGVNDTYTYTTWDLRGRLSRLDLPQGFATYAYYLDNTLRRHEVEQGAGTVFADSLARNLVGHVTKRLRFGPPSAHPDSVVYVYDDYARLKQSTTFDADLRVRSLLIGYMGEQFRYDDFGNRAWDARRWGTPDSAWHPLTYRYGAAGRLERTLDPNGLAYDTLITSYTYNEDGSLGSEHGRGSRPMANGHAAFFDRRFVYDALGRMVLYHRHVAWADSAAGGQDEIKRATRYDALGRRIADFNVLHDNPYPGTRYLYSGDYEALQLQVASGSGSDTVTVLLTRNPLDGSLLGRVNSEAGKLFYYRDEQGTAINSADVYGVLQGSDTTRFGAYGMPLNAAQSDGTGHGYTNGALADTVTGLLYLRNRFYDPNTGRFTQEDPIGFAGGVNLYAYVGDNPGSFTDPFGLQGTDTTKSQLQEYVEYARLLLKLAGKESVEVTIPPNQRVPFDFNGLVGTATTLGLITTVVARAPGGDIAASFEGAKRSVKLELEELPTLDAQSGGINLSTGEFYLNAHLRLVPPVKVTVTGNASSNTWNARMCWTIFCHTFLPSNRQPGAR